MNELAKRFSEWAAYSGWSIKLADEKRELPADIARRYAFIPPDWLEFIGCFDDIVNAEDNVWFLVPNNFTDNGGFAWNEFENISLGAAADDAEWAADVRGFWDEHLPIVMSVAGDYHYYAIGIKTGEVFEGWEPEFEDPQMCAPGFAAFIEHIISGKITLC